LSASQNLLLSMPLIFLSAAFRLLPASGIFALFQCGRPRPLKPVHLFQPPALALLLHPQFLPLLRFAALQCGVRNHRWPW
jgi:hypothetical protein